jgi:hypothetical protein
LLGQEAVADLSNEKAAIPPLLALLHLRSALVTPDAGGCQKSNAAAIREKKGDYLLAVKNNQPKLLAAIETAIDRAGRRVRGARLASGKDQHRTALGPDLRGFK